MNKTSHILSLVLDGISKTGVSEYTTNGHWTVLSELDKSDCTTVEVVWYDVVFGTVFMLRQTSLAALVMVLSEPDDSDNIAVGYPYFV